MVSTIFICFLALGLSATYGQYISDVESAESPISERRTFKHSKPLKLLPLIKKHKKFSKILPHVFPKAPYAEVPIIHEVPKPIYKVHRYQGIELKPVSDLTFSTPVPILESSSIEPSNVDFVSSVSSDHSLPVPTHPSSVLLYAINEKPIFSSPIFLPNPPAKQISSYIPVSQPLLPSIPITLSSISLARPVSNLVPAFPPTVFTSTPVSFPSIPPPPPPQPIFSSGPIKTQAPIQIPLPASSPAPIFPPIPVKIPAPVFPSIPTSSPPNVFSPVSVKIPTPTLPPTPTPSPVPLFSSFSTVSPTPGPAFSSVPVSLPPVQFSPVPSPSSSFTALPPSIPPNHELEYPYPPSGTPIPSFVKDISLSGIEIKDSPLSATEIPKYEEISSTFSDDGSKKVEHISDAIKNENGFFQKIKGWKADKAQAALSHFNHFKQRPFFQPSISISHPPHKSPVEISTSQVPIHSSLQFQGPLHPIPLGPAPAFFPPTSFFPPAKYENFPSNNVESPPLLNSYGMPISHDSYAPPFVPHDRLSTAASEEEPDVAAVPSAERNEQNLETKQLPSPQEFQPQNFQSQFQSQANSHNHPIYVPEENKTVKENKATEDAQPEVDNYEVQREPNSDVATNAHNYHNHKE